MAKNVELFDLPVDAFVETVHRWAIQPDIARERQITWLVLRQVISTLARLLWTLGQRVKKLEEEG